MTTTLYILYGSATGNAEHIAKALASKTPPPNGFDNVVCDAMEKFKKYSSAWSEAPANAKKHGLIVITSTTGNGDPPENASRFVRYLKRRTTVQEQPFKHVAFATLGLGDTNYDQFCETGKIVDRKLLELGGTRAKPLACADEGTGLEDVVEPWEETIFADMTKACSADHKIDNQELTTLTTTTTEVESSKNETAVPPPPPVLATTKSETPLFILYGSATGNAEEIAKDLTATYEGIIQNPDAQTFFPSVICCELDEYKKKCSSFWETEPSPKGTTHGVIVVSSTTGNGDPPENANRFARYCKRKTTIDAQPFRHCSFAVLGLGDTNYDQFCGAAKLLDKKMHELGGTRVKPLACADEATGLEDVVDPWTSTILSDINTHCRTINGKETVAVQETPTITSIAKEEENPTTTVANTPVKTVTETNDTAKPMLVLDQEEKKNDDFEVVPPSAQGASDDVSVGVQIVRAMLSLDYSCPINKVDPAALPKLGNIRCCCEFLCETSSMETTEKQNDSCDDMSVGSDDSTHYTMNHPYEASVIGARYLTATATNAASQLCETVGPSGLQSDNDVLASRDIFDKAFPLLLESPDSGTKDGAVVERNGKRVVEMTLSLPEDGTFQYQPGDSIGLVVDNTPEAVTFVLTMLREKHGIEATQKISIDKSEPLTVAMAVRSRFDLCTPIKNKRILQALSQVATSQDEMDALRLLASKTADGDCLFQEYVVKQRRTVVDILKDFPSCQSISLESLLSILTCIPPRYYSVSSSPLDKRDTSGPCLTVTFSVVDYLTPSLIVNGKEVGQQRVYGVATRYLEALCSGFLCSNASGPCSSQLKIFPKPTEDFTLPPSLATPMILVGPGTGIAPFIGFLNHRRALASNSGSSEQPVGTVDVFFGCRHLDHDWLYQDELTELKHEGIIANLYTAFSRDDPNNRQYVQDIMRTDSECASRLTELLMTKQGVVYICGDGNKMAKDVQASIADLIAKKLNGGDDEQAGREYLETMKSEGRLLLDIWTS